jgi:hypothetical protein
MAFFTKLLRGTAGTAAGGTSAGASAPKAKPVGAASQSLLGMASPDDSRGSLLAPKPYEYDDSQSLAVNLHRSRNPDWESAINSEGSSKPDMSGRRPHVDSMVMTAYQERDIAAKGSNAANYGGREAFDLLTSMPATADFDTVNKALAGKGLRPFADANDLSARNRALPGHDAGDWMGLETIVPVALGAIAGGAAGLYGAPGAASAAPASASQALGTGLSAGSTGAGGLSATAGGVTGLTATPAATAAFDAGIALTGGGTVAGAEALGSGLSPNATGANGLSPNATGANGITAPTSAGAEAVHATPQVARAAAPSAGILNTGITGSEILTGASLASSVAPLLMSAPEMPSLDDAPLRSEVEAPSNQTRQMETRAQRYERNARAAGAQRSGNKADLRGGPRRGPKARTGEARRALYGER